MKNQLKRYIVIIENLTSENPVMRIGIYSILIILALLIIVSICLDLKLQKL
jgi:hypothetical protein